MRQIKNTNVSDEVYEELKKSILSKQWIAGQKIPGELDLCKMMNVSRVSVRSAINRLVGMGVLKVRRGEGTFVSEVLEEEAFSSLLPYIMIDKIDIHEVLEFRRSIESEGALLAAEKISHEEVVTLEKLVEKMKTCPNMEQFAQLDLKFHNVIMMASRNKMLIKVTAILYDVLKENQVSIANSIGQQPAIYYHTQLCDVMRAHDGPQAYQVMRSHIDGIMEKMDAMETAVP